MRPGHNALGCGGVVVLLLRLLNEPSKPERCLQERLLAALGLCSCDSAGLSQLGAPALLQAFCDNTNTASKPIDRHIAKVPSHVHINPSCLAG